MVIHCNLSKMKNKILLIYLQGNYNDSLGEFSSTLFTIVCLGLKQSTGTFASNVDGTGKGGGGGAMCTCIPECTTTKGVLNHFKELAS